MIDMRCDISTNPAPTGFDARMHTGLQASNRLRGEFCTSVLTGAGAGVIATTGTVPTPFRWPSIE